MDRRIRKTRATLLEAMVRCAECTDWEDIAIQQICEEADVARSTFYLHFRNKAELLDYGFGVIGEEMRAVPKARSLDTDGALGVLPVLFDFMAGKNHGFLFRREQSSVATVGISRRLKSAIGDMIAEEIARSKRFADTPAHVVDFITAGVFAALEVWHHGGAKRPVGPIVVELDELILGLLDKQWSMRG